MVILTKKRFGFVKQDGTERIDAERFLTKGGICLLYTSPSPRDTR